MVVAGYLDRFEDPANRRQVRVSATRQGLDALEQMRELGTRQLTALLERVSDEDLAVIERAIRIMTTAIADQPTSTDPGSTR